MVNIASQWVGDGAHRVVFLHGLMGRGRNFSGTARSLGDEYCSLLIDLPNHGESGWTTHFDYLEISDRVADFIRQENTDSNGKLQSVALVGHSMGGKVAMLIALRYPELISKLVVVDISPGDAKVSAQSRFDNLLGPLFELDLEHIERRKDADTALSECIPNRVIRQFLLQNLRSEADGGYCWQPNLKLLYNSLDKILSWPEESFKPYTDPVAWIAGAKSEYIRDEDTGYMRELFPSVRKTTIADAGHWVHSEQPERFISVLKFFLKS